MFCHACNQEGLNQKHKWTSTKDVLGGAFFPLSGKLEKNHRERLVCAWSRARFKSFVVTFERCCHEYFEMKITPNLPLPWACGWTLIACVHSVTKLRSNNKTSQLQSIMNRGARSKIGWKNRRLRKTRCILPCRVSRRGSLPQRNQGLCLWRHLLVGAASRRTTLGRRATTPSWACCVYR